jgi:RNA polymerase sigma-70 factor (ECF subfamily)
MTERSNEAWLHDLQGESAQRDRAIADLRLRLQRGIYYYLSHERSDLAGLAPEELTHMSEDFVQEAVLRVLDNLESFRGDSQFTTWATKVAVRIAISELRRARYKDFSLDALVGDGDLRETASTLLNSASPDRPETAAEKAEALDHINRAFSEVLTPRQRAALEAVVLEGIPLDIVAEQLGTNRNALYKLIFDARRKLRGHLTEQGLSPDYILNLFER